MEQTVSAIHFTINGTPHNLTVKRSWTVLYMLRDILGLTGTKYGCGTGDCGACKILLDGKPVNSCTMIAAKADGKHIITIEGLQEEGRLSIIQQAFVNAGAIQCGFCTPGMIITAKALLSENPEPTEEEIRKAFDNNLCRCTGYVKIVEAVMAAAEKMAQIASRQAFLEEVRR